MKNIPNGATNLELGENDVLGHFDGVFGRLACGWAIDKTGAIEGLEIEILVDGRVVAAAVANEFRQDLAELGYGGGYCQFRALLPIELFDGGKRAVSARVRRGNIVLPGGPHFLQKSIATLREAFSEANIGTASPLSDYQVVMMKTVVTICEALAEQNKILQRLNSKVADSEGEKNNEKLVNVEAAVSRDGMIAESRYGHFLEDFRATRHKGDILVFSIIDWDFRIQRPQHIAANFGKLGYRVSYISVHLDRAVNGKSAFFLKSKPATNVFEVVLRCPDPVPSVYYGVEEPRQLKALCDGLAELTSILEVSAPTVIIQYPTWFPLASSIQGATLVFDCMDYLAGFSTASDRVLAMEEDLIKNADLVVTSSQYLKDMVGAKRDCVLIRNAAEVDFFAAEPHKVKEFGNAPVVGYYGAIAEWFDVELVRFAAEKRPDYKFVLVGSTAGADVAQLRNLKNVELVGEVPYVDIPSYLYAFDCAIIPFKLVELIKATNPVKLYEYFAAGKPVVATAIPELRQAPSKLLSIAKDEKTFVSLLDKALKSKEVGSADRRLWAFQHSWVKRSRDFLAAIDEAFPKVSVVVLTYNGLALTQACLDSLVKYSMYPNLEIICVDNNSEDGTPEYLQSWAAGRDNVKVILNAENRGFAEGNNCGIRAAAGDVIILLNNDTYVTPGWVRDLIRPILSDKSIGMVGPVTNMIGNEQKISIAYTDMEQMLEESQKFTRGRKFEFYKTENLAFFCVAIRRDVISKVGLLDAQYGLGFFEDDDYCRRVLSSGYRLAIADGVFVHHHLSGSFDKDPVMKRRLMTENRKKFEKKWGKWTPHKYRDAPGFGE